MKKYLVCFFLLCLVLGIAKGQFTEFGQDPSSVHWRQINTEKFRIVYDSAFEQKAQKIAALLDYSTSLVGNTLHQKHRKVPLLIHNQSVISNGMVVWAPKRMEWYTVAPQDIYAQDWFEQLAIHEGRHVAQMQRMVRFPTDVLSVIFGQASVGILAAQAHPWFMEGDAVTTETALTETGRGRLPSFEMGVRAHMLETHKPYNFRKSVFGSFKDYVPNHYELGYLMVAYNRVKYGPELWESVLDKIGTDPFFVNPFGLTPVLTVIKRRTYLNRKELYLKTYTELESIWLAKSKEIDYTYCDTINKRISTRYNSYKNPFPYENSVVTLKKSVDDIPRIVKIDLETSKEEVLTTPGYIPSEVISCNKEAIYWDEHVPDIRWEYRDYSVICEYSFSRKKKRYLTSKTRYFAPAPAPDGSSIAVVETDTKAQNAIVLIDPLDGLRMKYFPTPKNGSVQYPSWNATSNMLVMTLVSEIGKSMVSLDVNTGLWETLIEAGRTNISQARFYNNYILFNAAYSGIDNIYALDLGSKDIYQVTSSKYGAFDPNPDANTGYIFYSDYSSLGFNIVKSKINPADFIELDKVKNVSLNLAEKISNQEPSRFDNSKIEYKQYESKSYNKFLNLIHAHSWAPLYVYPGAASQLGEKVMPGYSVASQNLLGTLSLNGGQGYFKNHLYSSFSASYKAWFPVFTASILHGDTTLFIDDKDNFDASTQQLQFTGAVSFPMNLSRGDKIITLVPSIMYQYENKYFTNPYDYTKVQGVNKLIYSSTFSLYEKVSPKAIFPRLGFSVTGLYLSPLTSANLFSKQWVAGTKIYLPAIGRHSTLIVSASFEDQIGNYFVESNQLAAPRGYVSSWMTNEPNLSSMTTLAADYVFPIAYPDVTFLKVFYCKRVYGALYYQFSNAYVLSENASKNIDYSSVGAELSTDFNAFFFPSLLNIGVRGAYLTAKNKISVEVISRVSLDSF